MTAASKPRFATRLLLPAGLVLVLGVLGIDGRTANAGERAEEEAASDKNLFQWGPLAPLPDPYGFAGMYAGVSGEALIVAGGANFPYPSPWEDPDNKAKQWHDRVFVLPSPDAEWIVDDDLRLPRPLAYGVSVTWRDPATKRDCVICLGGGDAETHWADVFALRWNEGRLVTEALPSMPQPAAFFCGGLLDNTIYVAGGQDWAVDRPAADGQTTVPPAAMKTFWSLDLSKPVADRKWQVLLPWPGAARMQAVAAVQDGAFFLIGGVDLDQSKPGDDKRIFLRDCYRYDPKAGGWTQIADIPRLAAAAPSPAASLGHSHFAVVSGADGSNATLKDLHPGFRPTIQCYHTITDTWVDWGAFPKDPNAAGGGVWPTVTTNTTWWEDADGHRRYVIPSGEARPRIRTRNVYWGLPEQRRNTFGPLDMAVVGMYLAVLVAMGVYFSRREKTTGDFFLGGRRIPWWAAGLSIFGTQLSAITFMAIPARAYYSNWIYFLGNMTIVAVAPVVVFLYLPFFRRLQVVSAYEYLEKRFNLPTRLLGSSAFILFQLGRMGIVLYLPAMALSVVTGFNVYLCIGIMGVLATAYTVLGGIEAVIWTDVLQVFVLLGGAVLSLVIITMSIDGHFFTLLSESRAAGKLQMADFSWGITTTALWVVLLGKPFEALISYTSDQTVIQRYLTTSDSKAAAWSIWTNAVLTVPASILFFAVGTALWVYYHASPELLNPTGRTDDIFPWFIAQQLPTGVAGLVIAGLFAAAMSSLDSSMNSMATVITTDFHDRLLGAKSDRQTLRLARVLTVLLGVVGTGFAWYMAYLNSTSMWDQYSKLIGLLGGGLAGLFAVGIFTRRANGGGAILGFAASAAVLYFVSTHTAIHFFLYPTIGVGVCFVVGYLASFVAPDGRRDVEGLTIHSLFGRSEEAP